MANLIRSATCMLLFFYALLAVNAAENETENLLRNPSFEDGISGTLPDGYQKGNHYGKKAPDSSFALDKSEKHSGMQSLKLTCDGGATPTIVQSQTVEVKPEEKYLFTAFLKSNSETPLECRIFILSSDYKCMTSRNIFVDSTWKQYPITLTISNKQKSNKIFVRIDLKDKGAIWVDDLSLRKIDKDTDLASLDKRAYGYREKPDSGDKDVTIKIGDKTGEKLPNINGVCRFKSELKELKLKVVRVHNVLTSHDILSKDAKGKLQYNWSKIDKILDSIVEIGAVPQMSLCFVPMELVANPDPKKIRKDYNPPLYLAPPTDINGWEEYIHTLVKHCADKYDISGWYWIFGNEPGVAQFSMGNEEEFYNLYRHTITPALKAYPKIIIGAGSFAHIDWLKRFIERCGKDNTHVDILSWHHYGILPEHYLTNINRVKKWIAPYKNLKNAALAIDEWNPHLPDNKTPLSANEHAAAQQAATIKYMLDGGILYHAFFISSDAGRRNGLIQPDGTRNPTFNVLKMFGIMGEDKRLVTVAENEPYIGAIAASDKNGNAQIMLWNAKHDSDLSKGMLKNVSVNLGKEFLAKAVDIFMIDDTLSNGYNDPKHQNLEKTENFILKNGVVTLNMKPNSVALITTK